MVKADIKALILLLSNDLTCIRSTGVMQTKIGLLDEVKRQNALSSKHRTLKADGSLLWRKGDCEQPNVF